MVNIRRGFNSFLNRFGKSKGHEENKASKGSNEKADVDLQKLHQGVIRELKAKDASPPSKAPFVKRGSIQATRGGQTVSDEWKRGVIKRVSTQSSERNKPIKKASSKLKPSKLTENNRLDISARTFVNDSGQVRHLRKDLRPWVSNMHEAGRRSLDEIGKQFTKAINERNDL